MSEKIFLDELEKIGIKLDTKQINQFATYFQLLIEWNEKINLTSIVEKEQVYLKVCIGKSTTFFQIPLLTFEKRGL